MTTPLLYLSAYFERDRDEYYDQLLKVSESGDWESWLSYFLEGVAEQAHDALLRTRSVRELQEKHRRLLLALHSSSNALRLADELFARPYITTPAAALLLDVTPAGARGILDKLCDAGVIEEVEGYWPRLYVAKELLEAINSP